MVNRKDDDDTNKLPKNLRPKKRGKKETKQKETKHLICFLCREGTHVHDFGWNDCKCRHRNHGVLKDKR